MKLRRFEVSVFTVHMVVVLRIWSSSMTSQRIIWRIFIYIICFLLFLRVPKSLGKFQIEIKWWSSETRQVKSNRCLRLEFITVNQNTLCRFVCVCRTDMGERALESPDLGLCFKYPHHGCWMPRKFFTGPQRSGSHFFLSLVHSVEENLEISWSQKKWKLVVKMTWKQFFLNVSEVFGTWKDDVWDVFNMFRASQHL